LAITKLPSHTALSDAQFIQVQGPNELLSGFQYDLQTRTLYAKESQVVFPSHHGASHIGEDPIPGATCDSPGLLSADDKCKLDGLIQTRVGVLGFQGAGFPDDGGWLQGSIILAAGSEFISIERIGNVIRFTADSPVPLNCQCFLPGARVLMHDGTTKTIEDIAIGDLVVTHKGRVRRVRQLFRNQHNGSVYKWHADKHSGESFTITGNHPVMALERAAAFMPSGKVRKSVKHTPKWTEAAEVSAGDLVARRRSHNFSADISAIDVLETLGAGFVERNGLVYPVRDDGSIDGMAHGIPRMLPVNNDLLDLMGYYAAEGCASRKNGVRFSVHVDEVVFGDIGGEICRILSTLFGLEPAVRNRGTSKGRDIQVFSVALTELFSRWFGKKHDKRLPDWVTYLPDTKQARVVAALIRGDGYVANRAKGGVMFNLRLAARSLIDQALFMAERCGWEPAHQEPLSVNGHTRHRMVITASAAPDLCDLLGVERSVKKLSRERRAGDYVMHRLAEVSEIHYEGMVYNFEVEEDNSYVVDGIVVHNCEECVQLFWIQDETDVNAIRPPTCAGRLPGTNLYGELKIYLFPESTLVDPADATATLSNKGNYPALVFKRYDDALIPGTAELEIVLKRNASNLSTTEVGLAFTPGADGNPECIWFLGLDDAGGLRTFEFQARAEPGILGGLLYKGHLLTKRMAVITDYTSSILTTNQYQCRLWDVLQAVPVGDTITATNIWRYENPENPASGTDPKTLALDLAVDVLPIGTLVDIWQFQIGEVAGSPVYRSFFSQAPLPTATNTWDMIGGVEFGDVVQAKEETAPGDGSFDKSAAVTVSGIEDFEPTVWGLTGYDCPVLLLADVATHGTEGTSLSSQHRARIDTSLPGLVVEADVGTEPFSQRPVLLWNRTGLANSMYIRAEVGIPTASAFSPFDILLHAPIANHDEAFVRVAGLGVANGLHYVRVKGAGFKDLPQRGTLRIINKDTGRRNRLFNFYNKLMFPAADDDSIGLLASAADNHAFPGAAGDIAELVHPEYSAPCVRLEFTLDGTEVTMQAKVGVLGMDVPYENDAADDIDDYVRGLQAGYAVSATYTQADGWDGTGTQPTVNVDNLVMYNGGTASDSQERWNVLEIMLRNDQVWIWWNGLLIPPNSVLSGALSTPVTITTPYFQVASPRTYGKFGMRMWPGARLRRVEVRSQPKTFSEFIHGQLELA
jgi:intein/homing endonuclease